jgi:hypothetical protein
MVFEKLSENILDNPLAGLIKKSKNTQITNIRNEKEPDFRFHTH